MRLNFPNSASQLAIVSEALSEVGFAQFQIGSEEHADHWWFRTRPVSDGTTTLLQIVRRKGFKILTVHFGWQNPFVRQFVIEAMQRSWPAGLQIIPEEDLTKMPCFLMFNLGDKSSWPLAGMPFDCSEQEFLGHAKELKELLANLVIPISTAEELLESYLADVKPVRWLGGNTAIRFAEAAGLVKLLGRDRDLLTVCAHRYARFIETHMFGRGSGSDWTNALLERL